MSIFSIKDLAELSGIRQHTIRAWEQRYSFLVPARTESQQRVYSADEVDILLNVSLLNQNGYKLSQIDKMTMEEKLQLVSKVIDQQQKAVNKLIIEMARMSPTGFEMIVDNCIHTWGIHETTECVLIPFVKRLQLWHSGYNKNYIENTVIIRGNIREKLHLAIHEAQYDAGRNQSIVLFLNGSDEGELVMLYLQYKLKMLGFNMINPGYAPMDHLALICKQIKPRYLITFASKKKERDTMAALVAKHVQLKAPTEFLLLDNNNLEEDTNATEHGEFLSQTLQKIMKGVENLS